MDKEVWCLLILFVINIDNEISFLIYQENLNLQ